MPRGSAPGERRGGRQKGTPNKATADIKALAQEYGPEAITRLVDIMMNSESDQAKLGAIKELLDRGYGKAKQQVEATGPNGGPMTFERIIRTIVDPAKAE